MDKKYVSVFFKFLSGCCKIFREPCKYCGCPDPDAIHFMLICNHLNSDRVLFMGKVRKLLSNHYKRILPYLNDFIRSNHAMAAQILFGANRIDIKNGEVFLSREFKEFSNPLNCLPRLTAEFVHTIFTNYYYA